MEVVDNTLPHCCRHHSNDRLGRRGVKSVDCHEKVCLNVENGICMTKNKGQILDRRVIKRLDGQKSLETVAFSGRTCEVAISF